MNSPQPPVDSQRQETSGVPLVTPDGPPRLGRAIVIALCILLVGAAICWSAPNLVSRAMASVTGEEDLWQQIKGTGAWLLLKLHSAPETTPLAPMRNSGLSPYGINTFLEQEAEEEKVERSMALIAGAGFTWIRQEFPWEDIEITGKGDYWDHRWDRSAWDKYDRIVDLAEQYDLEIIARLDNPPAWSRAVGNAEGWTMAPPDDFEDYGDFVSAVVSRYRGRIRYYQIWNEPNIYPEWGDQPVDPEAYVELLKIAYARAKEADPDCVVIAAGLAQTTESGPRNLSDIVFLERMYAAGARGNFDVMGAMVYGLWTGPLDRRTSPDRTNFGRVQLLREIMVRNGDADIPIWATEVGWNALPDGYTGSAVYGRVSEEKQAEYAVQAYERAAREWPWLGVLNYWFFRRPSEAEHDQAWYYFRMVEPDFSRLPVYSAMATLTAEQKSVALGYHQEDHWALHYVGPWTDKRSEVAVLGGYREASSGAELQFAFEGTALDLVVVNPASADNIAVFLDGRRVRRIAPGTAPVNGAPTLQIASHLKDTTHVARIVIVSEGFALDGLVVNRETNWPAYAIPVTLGALLGGGLTLSLRKRTRA
ncbi:MAG: cellulase family glycosylhydrolase [Anaerolineae bacterium]